MVEEIITEATKVKTNTEGTEVVEETPEETPEMVKTSTEGTEVKTKVKDGSFILKDQRGGRTRVSERRPQTRGGRHSERGRRGLS